MRRRRHSRARALRLAVAASIAAAIAGLASQPRADVRPLTLYQKTARASLVVRARAISDATRRPPMEVIEVYKGVFPGRTLYIVPFVQDYGSPKPWLHREVFRKGVEYVLFLVPFEGDEDRDFRPEAVAPPADDEKPQNLFTVLNADQGQLTVPAEGAAALTEAIRRFVAILSLGQHDLQGEALRSLLHEKNPYLIDAGLEELARFDLGTEEDIPALLAMLRVDRETVREGALRVLSEVAAGPRPQGRDLRDRQEVFTRIVDRLYSDPSREVRSAAVKALLAVGGEGVEAVLRSVSRADADQQVRYEAQIALLSITGGLRPPGHRP